MFSSPLLTTPKLAKSHQNPRETLGQTYPSNHHQEKPKIPSRKHQEKKINHHHI